VDREWFLGMTMKPRWINSKPPEERSPFWWLRWVPTVVLSVLILYGLYVLGRVAIIPVLASFALAYLLNPIVYQGEKRGLSRTLASIVAILLVTLAAVAFLAFVIPNLWEESTLAGQKIARQFTPENAARQRAMLKRYWPTVERLAGDKIEEVLSDPTAAAGSTALEAGGGQSGLLSMLVSSLDLLLVPFFVFYILVDFGKWRDSSEGLIPPRFREPFSRLFDEVGRILESYVRGQLLIGLIMAVLYAVGFFLLGVPAWAGIAALAGLLNAIPYVGTLLGLLLACGFTLAGGGGGWEIAAIVGVFIAVQSIEGYYLTPRILGGRLNLHPMAVFLGLLIGGKLFGLLGVILAIPAIAIAKVFLKFFRELYQQSYFFHRGDIHPAEAPSEVLEDRIADAADTVLAEQTETTDKDADKDDLPAVVEEGV
jgi:predicted PurR-regulated permease PerM